MTLAEHVLRGQVNLAPDEDGARHILVMEPSGELYRIPMSAEGAAEFGKALLMTDEELLEEKTRAQAKEKLVVPGTNGHDVRQPL